MDHFRKDNSLVKEIKLLELEAFFSTKTTKKKDNDVQLRPMG